MAPSITICSSFRFYPDVVRLQRELEEAGIRCEIPIPNEYLDPKNPSNLREGLVELKPEMFSALWKSVGDHLKRIVDTSLIYVFGGNKGYVGRGVSAEMGYGHCLKKYDPLQKSRSILSSAPLSDITMRAFVEEVVRPEQLIRRLQ
jgi:hypothetical protein